MRYFFVPLQILLLISPTFLSAESLLLSPSGENRIDSHLEYMIESGVSSDIKSLLDGDFVRIEEEKLNFGFQKETYWFRLSLKHPRDANEDFYLVLDYPLLDEVEFFYLENGIVKSSLVSGDRHPFAKRSFDYRLINFKIPTSGSPSNAEGTIVFRVKTSGSMQVGGKILSYHALTEQKSEESTIFGIYYGGMIVLFLYHIILFFILREKIYIYFCTFIFTFFIGQMLLTGIFFDWIAPNIPALSNLLLSPILFFSLSSMTLFQKIFLGTDERPIFNKILGYAFMIVLGLGVLSIILPYNVSIQLIVISSIIIPLILLIYAILRLKDGYKPARYYLLGWVLYLIGVAVYALKTIAILPTNLVTEYIAQFGSFIQVIFFSIALADRINAIQDEKAEAQKDALKNLTKVNQLKDEWTKDLELQVKERTRNLEDALEKIQESENTLINQNKQVEAITEAAIEVQNFGNRKSIMKTLGRFLSTRFKIDSTLYFTINENAIWNLKEYYGNTVEYSHYNEFSDIHSSICEEVSHCQEIVYLRYEKEMGEFTRVTTKQKNTAKLNDDVPEEIQWDMGRLDISAEDILDVPGFFIGIPVPFQNEIMGILICTSQFQSLTHVPISPDLLERLSRLIAGPIHLGEKQLKYIRELQKTQIDLERSKSQLTQAEKMSSLGQMVAGISHEIANPINYIGAARANLDKQIQSLRDEIISQADGDDEESREVIEEFRTRFADIIEGLGDIEKGVQKVTEINRAMANFSRLDTEPQRDVSLSKLVDESIVILSHKLKNLQIEKEYEEDIRIDCHPSQISQVIMNLISNACDAIMQNPDSENPNQEKKISIRIQKTKSIENLTPKGDTPSNPHEDMELIIEDSGPGIPMESRKKIFDAFYTTKPIGVGTGLGLAVTGNIIKKHKGKISIGTSAKLGGAKFRVIFPHRRSGDQ